MAGSYDMAHKNVYLLENMGDAGEAIEEMLWLIGRHIGHDKALQSLNEEYYPMVRGEMETDVHYRVVRNNSDRGL